MNDPRIKKWLGEVVGKEGEDLSRHDKWLCMIYPRLVLLHKLLAVDGVIYISIDDNEVAHLRMLLDEVFGANCFLAHIHWQKRYTRSNNTDSFTTVIEHILSYSKRPGYLPNLLQRDADADARYSNPDNDPRGPWKAIPFLNQVAPEKRPNLVYDIVNPNTGEIIRATRKAWRSDRAVWEEHVACNRVWWGVDGKARMPNIKRFLSEVKQGITPINFFDYQFAGHTDTANREIKELFGEKLFDTPKPSLLIQRILELATDRDSIILDSFAGSGTTAHAVLNLNKRDGGNRKFILIEMMDYAESITAERVRRVMKGYGQGDKAVEGTGGSFDFYTLGVPLFTDGNLLNEEVGVERIREYIWFTETRSTAPAMALDAAPNPYYLGRHQDTAYYFVYEKEDLTTLDHDLLATLPAKGERTVIYADNCLLPKKFMEQHGIVFKKIPRDITRF